MRLNKIVYDSIFTHHLTFLRFVPSRLIVPGCLSTYFIDPLPDLILDRFCSHILPQIHEKIKWLYVEPLSMERILATNYPNLSGLGLFNIEGERAMHLFSDETLFSCNLKNQILSLVIDINTNGTQSFIWGRNLIIFTHIFTMLTNLRYLNFGPSGIWDQRLSFDTPFVSVVSTSLLELRVCLIHFADCLYLLDGRFNQLHKLYVDIACISSFGFIINSKDKLLNLKCFSLCCDWDTYVYDELIVPLLHRMSNLEKLDLDLFVCGRETFFDGNDLKVNIINNMPRLNKFTFNIRSSSEFYNQINLPSNEDMQKTFRDFNDQEIIYYGTYFPKAKYGQCHIYSYPYKAKHYDGLTNDFPGGIFKCVRKVSLFDERPFEHEFFLRIGISFPLLEILIVNNQKRQSDKRFRKSKNENQDLSIVQYPRLIQLDLSKAHKDYHEQFLFDTKACLPNGICISMVYQLVKRVTRNFRRNTTRSNCAKIGYVYFYNQSVFPEHLKEYFPHVKIF